jgi:hypothetical protein
MNTAYPTVTLLLALCAGGVHAQQSAPAQTPGTPTPQPYTNPQPRVVPRSPGGNPPLLIRPPANRGDQTDRQDSAPRRPGPPPKENSP